MVNVTADAVFELQEYPEMLADWAAFFAACQPEYDEAYDYSFRVLKGYLTPQFGGIRMGGGGGDYPFKLVWPVVARLMSS